MGLENRIKENQSLASLTYYKIGGAARYFFQPENLEDLKFASDFIKKNKLNYIVLGAGSNVLIDDSGFDGFVLQTAKLNKTLEQTNSVIKVGCSVLVIHLLRFCMKEGFGGLDFLVGIPGNMGGVFYMNAGTKSGEICKVLEELEVYDLKNNSTRILKKADLNYTYRKQHFLNQHEIILQGNLSVRKEDAVQVQAQIQTLLESRKKTQPIDKPSCGSVFKNPPGHAAWKLIDDAGLRGRQIGNAQISPMHSNFIVNLGGAKSADVKALIELAKSEVLKKSKIQLEEEVQFIEKLSVAAF